MVGQKGHVGDRCCYPQEDNPAPTAARVLFARPDFDAWYSTQACTRPTSAMGSETKLTSIQNGQQNRDLALLGNSAATEDHRGL